MKVEKILKKLKASYSEKDDSALRSVAASVYYSGEAEEILADSDLLDKMFASYDHRVNVFKTSVNSQDPDQCPICKIPLTGVKLDSDRKAKWCNRHFVVLPIKE